MMSIPKESLEKLLYLRREMDRIFREFFDPERPEAFSSGGRLDISVDVYESEGEIIIEAELPGIDRDSVRLSVLRDVVVIEGTKHKENIADVSYHRVERSYGQFRRIVEIPKAGDTRNIKAEYKQGLLCIKMPKIVDRRGNQRIVPID